VSAPAHTGPTRVAADSTGNHLYVINQTSNDLSAYSISRSDGSLAGVSGSPYALGQTPTNVAVAPSGKYVYVSTLNSLNNPTSLVYAFAVQSDGSLTAVSRSPFSTVNWAEALAIDPQGKYLYVSSSPLTSTPSVSQVDAFSIDSDGALTEISGAPYTEPNSQFCANGAWDVAIHPSGKFLLLPNLCEGNVIYSIDPTTGTLTLVNGSPFSPPGPGFAATGDVQSIAMDPQGTYFWVTDSYCDSGCSMSTDTWKLDTTTGLPTYISSGIAGCGLLARSDPSGKFLYEVGDTDSIACGGTGNDMPGIWGFNVNRANGGLTNLSGSPWQSPNSDSSFTDGLAITP
jgi:6-phosphogluconolactonase